MDFAEGGHMCIFFFVNHNFITFVWGVWLLTFTNITYNITLLNILILVPILSSLPA